MIQQAIELYLIAITKSFLDLEIVLKSMELTI